MGEAAAVFVDRDDTLMVDVGYCGNPEEVQLLPGAAEGLRLLSEHGYHVIVVTNQSGIGRGHFSPRDLEAVHSRLREELQAHGANFHSVYFCPHLPDEGCSCRKPMPGLLLRAASELNLDLCSSFTVGNREWDIEAGKAAGTRTILLSRNANSNGESNKQNTDADFVAQNMLEAALLIIKLDSERNKTS